MTTLANQIADDPMFLSLLDGLERERQQLAQIIGDARRRTDLARVRALAICRSDVAQGSEIPESRSGQCLFIALRFSRVRLVEIERVRGLDGRVKLRRVTSLLARTIA